MNHHNVYIWSWYITPWIMNLTHKALTNSMNTVVICVHGTNLNLEFYHALSLLCLCVLKFGVRIVLIHDIIFSLSQLSSRKCWLILLIDHKRQIVFQLNNEDKYCNWKADTRVGGLANILISKSGTATHSKLLLLEPVVTFLRGWSVSFCNCTTVKPMAFICIPLFLKLYQFLSTDFSGGTRTPERTHSWWIF